VGPRSKEGSVYRKTEIGKTVFDDQILRLFLEPQTHLRLPIPASTRMTV
jgi:hypothetical protein